MDNPKGQLDSSTPGGGHLRGTMASEVNRSSLATTDMKSKQSVAYKDDLTSVRSTSFTGKRGTPHPMRVNPELVVKQGLLFKKG